MLKHVWTADRYQESSGIVSLDYLGRLLNFLPPFSGQVYRKSSVRVHTASPSSGTILKCLY